MGYGYFSPETNRISYLQNGASFLSGSHFESNRKAPVPFFSPFFLRSQTGNKLSFNSANSLELGSLNKVQRMSSSDTTSFMTTPSASFGTTLEGVTVKVLSAVSSTLSPIFDNGDLTESAVSYSDEDYQSTENLDIFTNFTFNDTVRKIQDESKFQFNISEYAVFGAVLLLSTAIGVFYGCCSKGQKSTAEYLIANRRMSTIPAALSLLCSFISAITVLGNPVEIYLYGSSYGLIVATFIPLTITLAYFYVPVFFHLQLTSAYEYFELRFDRWVRTIISFFGILHYVIYMSIVVYGPALAIGQVTGINTRISTALIFGVCIFYSTLGGLKGVIATDALQAVIMVGSLGAIVYKGTIDLGGPTTVWQTAEKYNRTDFLNLDINPTTRHTLWTSLIGGYMLWLPNFAATHSQVQRYLSMPSLGSIRRALFLNMIGFTLIFGLCYWAGLLLFAKYHSCDPIQYGSVTKPDQLLPLFVIQTMSSIPGLPGLFIAGITCASLSTVSTGLNALSAIVTYDYIKSWRPLVKDAVLLQFSRTFCVIFGAISFGFIFLAERFGDILPAAFSVAAVVVAPTLGLYTLGMFFPWANSKGSLLGLLSAFFIMTTLTVGNYFAKIENLLPNQILEGLTTESCPSPSFTIKNLAEGNSPNVTAQRQIGRLEEIGNEFVLSLFSISYMWYPALGCFLTVFFGLLFSLMVSSCDHYKPVSPDYLSPPMLWLWVKLFPSHALKWIDFDLEDYPMTSTRSSRSATLSLRSSDFSFRKETVCDMKIKRVTILPHQIPLPSIPAGPQTIQTESIEELTTADSLS